MSDFTYGKITIHELPTWTDDDEEHLKLLETAFIAGGGRGPEIADALDRLGRRRDIAGEGNYNIIERLNDRGWERTTDEPHDPLPWYFYQDVVCGHVDSGADGLIEDFSAAGVSFVISEDPKCDWLGVVWMYSPTLGHFTAECDSDENVLLTAAQVDAIIEDHGRGHGQLVDLLRVATGYSWRKRFGLVEEVER